MNRISSGSNTSNTDPLASSYPNATPGGYMRIIGREYSSSPGPGPELMAADTLDGDRVVNAAGEELGKITDIVLDVHRGRIAYAVLSVGGFLVGIGGKLFAVPWGAMALDVEHKCFVLDVNKEWLDQATGFDKNNWPRMADPTWAKTVHETYGLQPYWEF